MKISPKTINRVIVALAILYLLINPGFRRLVKHEIEKRKLLSKMEQLRKENEKLATEIQLLETDKNYYASVVRRELKMLKPGEVEYRIIVDNSKKNKSPTE